MPYSDSIDKLGQVSYSAFFFLENKYGVDIKYHWIFEKQTSPLNVSIQK